MSALNLTNLLSRFSDHWAQRTNASLNDYDIKLAKLLGEFIWHTHDDTDEMFLVLSGRLVIQLRDHDVVLNEGELFVVGKGVEHVSSSMLIIAICRYRVEVLLNGFCFLQVVRTGESCLTLGPLLICDIDSAQRQMKRCLSC